MGIKQEIIIEGDRSLKESLIETKYVGKNPKLKGTSGYAFYDFTKNSWKYRVGNSWHCVNLDEIDCADTDGWVRGKYTGDRNLPDTGKAYWSESEEAWKYRPAKDKRIYTIPDEDFVMGRDRGI